MNTVSNPLYKNLISSLISKKSIFLWDFDGCFADTESLHFEAYSQAFAKIGHKLTESEYYPSFTHLGDGTASEIQKYGLDTTIEEINNLKKDYYWQIINTQKVTLFPEIEDIVTLLVGLHGGNGRIAIASNSPAKEIEVILKRAGYRGPMHAIIGRSENLRKKPAPDIFLHALKMLNAKSEDALVFEDSQRGLAAASAANCEAVWLRTIYNSELSTTVSFAAQCSHLELLSQLKGLK